MNWKYLNISSKSLCRLNEYTHRWLKHGDTIIDITLYLCRDVYYYRNIDLFNRSMFIYQQIGIISSQLYRNSLKFAQYKLTQYAKSFRIFHWYMFFLLNKINLWEKRYSLSIWYGRCIIRLTDNEQE